MWRSALWCQLSALVLVSATINLPFFTPRRQHAPINQVNCFEYVLPAIERVSKPFDSGLRLQKKPKQNQYAVPTVPTHGVLPNPNLISRRFDQLLSGADIVKEHAKLVQDINSLRQVVFVAPMVDENRDYDDSILHEIIETSTTPRPTTTRPTPPRVTKPSSIPVILLGGASQRQTIKATPQKYPKPYINLVGTSVSPLVKHPYPFVMQASATRKPVKICMPTMPSMYATTKRPSFWQRLLNSLIPR